MLEKAVRITEMGAMSRQLSKSFGVGFTFEAADSAIFQVEQSAFTLGRLKLAKFSFSPHRTRRSVRPPLSSRSVFLVNQIVEGQLIVSQDGREAVVGAGDIYLLNPAREFTLETGSLITNSLYIDATAFRSAFPEIDCCTATPLRAYEAEAVMISEMVSSLFRHGDGLSNAARERSGEVLPHILVIGFAKRIAQSESCPSKLSLFHKERIKSFVRDHLANPGLSCEFIADSLRLSQRYIYDVFADEPLPLMHWIRRERLERCRRELCSPALRNRSISEIAFSWGFADFPNFSRRFSAEFGQSPRAFRESQLGDPPDLNNADHTRRRRCQLAEGLNAPAAKLSNAYEETLAMRLQ